MSQDRDTTAMMRGHPIPRFETMNRIPRIPLALSITALGAALLLSGCSIGVTDPKDASSTKTSGAADTKKGGATPADDTTKSGGAGLGAIANGPCDGRDFDIDQNGATLVLDGACGDVTISADDVSVNLDTAASLTITGSTVHVIVNGDLPALTLSGDVNTVNGENMGTVKVNGTNGTVLAKEVTALSATGSYNTVNWDSGVQSAQDTGTGNIFVGPM
jgi:hypothetical protein